jgi:AbrB family looped-hinge helix DNA binding protein
MACSRNCAGVNCRIAIAHGFVKMPAATVSSKYQIAFPKEVREAMHIQPGQQFEFIPMGRVLQLAPKTTIKELRGIARGANPAHYRDRKDRA